MVPEWLYGTALVVVLAHTAALFVLYRQNQRNHRRVADAEESDTGESHAEESDTGNPDGDVVACPECGSANERGYRFCRSCVSELPGTPARAGANATARSRRLT